MNTYAPRRNCNEVLASSSRFFDRSQVGVSGIMYIAPKSKAGKALKIQAKTFQDTKAPITYVIKMPKDRKIAVKAPRAPRTRGDEHSPIYYAPNKESFELH